MDAWPRRMDAGASRERVGRVAPIASPARAPVSQCACDAMHHDARSWSSPALALCLQCADGAELPTMPPCRPCAPLYPAPQTRRTKRPARPGPRAAPNKASRAARCTVGYRHGAPCSARAQSAVPLHGLIQHLVRGACSQRRLLRALVGPRGSARPVTPAGPCGALSTRTKPSLAGRRMGTHMSQEADGWALLSQRRSLMPP